MFAPIGRLGHGCRQDSWRLRRSFVADEGDEALETSKTENIYSYSLRHHIISTHAHAMSMVDLRGGKHTPPNTTKLGINSNTSLLSFYLHWRRRLRSQLELEREGKSSHSYILGNIGLGKYYSMLCKKAILGGLFVFIYSPYPLHLHTVFTSCLLLDFRFYRTNCISRDRSVAFSF